jgi:beta-lactamase superfamily II metal-dependent hydrolase
MATQAQPIAQTGLRIRMYRIGFGDFFLVSVPKDGGFAHILIDCGVHAKDLGVMGEAVTQLKADTGGQLALVIMTHRHADHISGFGSQRALFATFSVERVWMSYFEDPKNAAAMRIQAGIAATATRLQAALAAGGATEEDSEHLRMAGNALGAAASGNAAALEMLRHFKTPDGGVTPVEYYKAGQPANLPPSLADAGLEAEILGPPTDKDLLDKMDNVSHQYLTAADEADAAPRSPFNSAYALDPSSYSWPRDIAPLFDPAKVRTNVAGSQPQSLAIAAQKADNALNNQSLVVLFTFRGKTMLFAGDAQWGNWANFLFGGPIGTKGHADLTPRAREVLGNLDFYKVGHHGSRNATPIDVVSAMKPGCVAMCSTQPKAYNEVPRQRLMDALRDKTGGQVARSDQVAVGDSDDAKVTAGLPALAPVFKPGPHGTIDYFL